MVKEWEFTVGKSLNIESLDEAFRASDAQYHNLKVRGNTIIVRVDDDKDDAHREAMQSIIDAHDHTVESVGKQQQMAKRVAKNAIRVELDNGDARVNESRVAELNAVAPGIIDSEKFKSLKIADALNLIQELAARIERLERGVDDPL
ncbi:MAG: hypothetical protein ACPG7F_00315 [Aggregatilineales bacterium]